MSNRWPSTDEMIDRPVWPGVAAEWEAQRRAIERVLGHDEREWANHAAAVASTGRHPSVERERKETPR